MGSEDSVDFKEIKAQCITSYKKVSQKRFKRFSSGYVWDKWIGTVYILICFGFLFFVAQSYNYDLDYYKCGSEVPGYITNNPAELCENPFYKPHNAWKSRPFLPPGEYGTKPGPLFHSVTYIPILLFMISGLLNHLLHNTGGRKP